MAAKQGLLFALELGKDKAELEVWKSIEGDQDRSYGGNILRDIFMYNSYFSEFRCMTLPCC